MPVISRVLTPFLIRKFKTYPKTFIEFDRLPLPCVHSNNRFLFQDWNDKSNSPFTCTVTADDSLFSFFNIFISFWGERLDKGRNLYFTMYDISISSQFGFVIKPDIFPLIDFLSSLSIFCSYMMLYLDSGIGRIDYLQNLILNNKKYLNALKA